MNKFINWRPPTGKRAEMVATRELGGDGEGLRWDGGRGRWQQCQAEGYRGRSFGWGRVRRVVCEAPGEKWGKGGWLMVGRLQAQIRNCAPPPAPFPAPHVLSRPPPRGRGVGPGLRAGVAAYRVSRSSGAARPPSLQATGPGGRPRSLPRPLGPPESGGRH